MISVVMFTQNNERTACASIASILNQTYKNWEMIIVDNYSSDKTALMIKPYLNMGNIKYYQLNHDSNFNELMREALLHVRYDRIAFIKPGELWHSDKLQKQLPYLNHEIIFTNFDFIDLTNKKITPKNEVMFQQATYNFLLKYQVIPWSSVVIERRLLNYYPFMKEVEMNEYAWLLNILKKGYIAKRIDKALVSIPYQEKYAIGKSTHESLKKVYHYLGYSKGKSFLLAKKFIKNQFKYANPL